MVNLSSIGSNSPRNSLNSSSGHLGSLSINNAPPTIPPPPPLSFPIFLLPFQTFIPQEVQPWEGSEEEEEKDLEALRLKAKEDAEDAFMGNVPRGRRRRKAS